MVIMARRKKNQQNQAAEVDQPGATSEMPAGGDPGAPGSLVPATDGGAQLGNEPTAFSTEGNTGDGLEENGAESTSIQDAEERSRRAFFGRSGHLAVMSEFLHRLINVAIPEVDVGDDVFVVKGSDDTVTRVQVKAATAKAQANGYSAQFNVPLAQLSVPGDTPALVYVFAARFQNRWSDFVVIRRSTMFARVNEGAGSLIVPRGGEEYVRLRIVFTAEAAQCGPVDLQRYRNVWDPWPPFQLEEEDALAQSQGDTGDGVPPGIQRPGGNVAQQPETPDDSTPATPTLG
jgi:hypothetical protein